MALEYGLARAPLAALVGGDAQLNSAIALSVLGGEPGPARDVVLLNAGAALFVAGGRRTSVRAWRWPPRSIDTGRGADVVTAAARVPVS